MLNVETGTGVASPAANSYVTVAEADQYHSDMGNTDWAAATTALKEAALIRACRSIDRMYARKFKGSPTNFGTQNLEWPRSGVWLSDQAQNYDVADYTGSVADNVIPKALKEAQFEAAIRELQVPGSLTPDLDRGGAIKSVQAGSVGVTYSDGANPKTVFQAIQGALVHLLTNRGCDMELG